LLGSFTYSNHPIDFFIEGDKFNGREFISSVELNTSLFKLLLADINNVLKVVKVKLVIPEDKLIQLLEKLIQDKV